MLELIFILTRATYRKLRLSVPSFQHLLDAELLLIKTQVNADRPHKDIHNFVGSIQLFEAGGSTVVESLSMENMLWTNTVVASGTTLGVVVYTGQDTRAVMNTSHPKSKMGVFDHEINRLSIVCVP